MSSLTRVSAKLVEWLRTATGSTKRNLQDKLDDTPPSLLDFGAVGDNQTDNTNAVNNALASLSKAGKLLVPSKGTRESDKYRVTGFYNPYGIELEGKGQVVIPQTVGGVRTVQYPMDYKQTEFGKEYMYRALQQISVGQGREDATLKIAFFGDSTVAKGNMDAGYDSDEYFLRHMQRIGLPNVTITNAAVGGTTIQVWNPLPYLEDGSYQMFVISYGINDGGTGQTERLEQFMTKLRSDLAAIRAHPNGSLNKLTIVWKMSNSTNDTTNNRDAYWYIQLRPLIMQACRDYQVVFWDCFSKMPDSYNLAGYMLDNPFNDGRGIHPRARYIPLIWGGLVDFLFGGDQASDYRTNNVRNAGAVSGSPSSATGALSYDYGVNIYRAIKGTGLWDVDGAAVTIRQVDGVSLQANFGFNSNKPIVAFRTWNINSGQWSLVSGKPYGLTPAGGWQATEAPEARISIDGVVTINAKLTSGSTANSTTILTGLPAEMFPKEEKRVICANEDGTTTCIGVNTSGAIFLVGANTKSTLHVNITYQVPRG